MGTLFLVATPIGNMEDVTLRALRVLGEVGLVAAEDTRTARKLMAHHGISNRVLSYTEHNMAERTPQIMKVLEAGGDVALVSEAGTPGISDPGFELIKTVIEADHKVSSIPGPAAPIAAVVASGLPSAEFTFLGFLPRRSIDRRRLFESVRESPRTLVAFESPHRIQKSLQDLLATVGDRRMAACREMTKLHEETYRGTVSEAISHFTAPRGEFTLVVEGATNAPPELSDDQIVAMLTSLANDGTSTRDAVARVVEDTGLSRQRVYRLAVKSQAPD